MNSRKMVDVSHQLKTMDRGLVNLSSFCLSRRRTVFESISSRCTVLHLVLLLAIAGCSSNTKESPTTGSPAAGSLAAGSLAAESLATTSAEVRAERPDKPIGVPSGLVDSLVGPAGSPAEPHDLKRQPKLRTVRKVLAPAGLPAIPDVLLSAAHAKLCRLQVGETFSDFTLPRLGGSPTNLESLRGKQATVVLFWQPDRWMARMALSDLQRDIAGHRDPQQIGVVGIAVQQPVEAVKAALNDVPLHGTKASFPQLLDSQGQLFATIGSYALPRIYVLGAAGKVVWFDIEYSESTRRELKRTLKVLSEQKE